ncbi:uncharacterized protein IL334_007010 [Kwoniella shivajii]|uniref:Uncharacterized protein n=1 Tax=Kwoniella shivajii TaxID=564305 RepID=A0ABZ1DBH0_9TREE|nr:hypothetical protein IL334_007010 [Kwoniella shivajii]
MSFPITDVPSGASCFTSAPSIGQASTTTLLLSKLDRLIATNASESTHSENNVSAWSIANSVLACVHAQNTQRHAARGSYVSDSSSTQDTQQVVSKVREIVSTLPQEFRDAVTREVRKLNLIDAVSDSPTYPETRVNVFLHEDDYSNV